MSKPSADKVVEELLAPTGESTGIRQWVAPQKRTQQVMLCVVRKNGDRILLPYAYLLYVELKASSAEEVGLRVSFASHKIEIRGRNVSELCGDLQDHRLREIAESDLPFDDGEGSVFIREIEVQEVDGA